MKEKARGEQWEEVGEYLGYKIFGNGNKRRLIEHDTGEVIKEYEI